MKELNSVLDALQRIVGLEPKNKEISYEKLENGQILVFCSRHSRMTLVGNPTGASLLSINHYYRHPDCKKGNTVKIGDSKAEYEDLLNKETTLVKPADF